jgi:glycerol uptake facilitator-like aquaporin
MVFGPATGAGFNPARWLGPALASGTFSNFWIYIVGPVAGALAAAVGYRALVLDRQVPESVPAGHSANGGSQ